MLSRNDCAHRQKMYYGAIYILFFSISTMIACSFNQFLSQIWTFVRDGNLPNENTRRRQKIILIAVWSVASVNWIVFTVVNVHYTETQQFELLWNFNFGEDVFLAIMIGLTLYYFGNSSMNIRRLYKMIDNEKNTKTLNYLKNFTGIAFLVQSIYLLFQILGIFTQGYYGVLAIWVDICQSISLLIAGFTMFVIIALFDFDVKLTT